MRAQSVKAEGNVFFKAKKYPEAVQKYTQAISLDSSDVTFFSNRSACYAAMNEWEKAAEDGKQCVVTDKKFVKGYFRAAIALQTMGKTDDALSYVTRGLGIDSTNADLKKMSRELDEENRLRKVEGSIAQAESMIKSGDIPGAYKGIDAALRLDPTNSTLNSMMNKVRPMYERSEKARVSTLDPNERIKEEADNMYKAANFEGAIKVYGKCLDKIKDKSSSLALKCYGNRSACYKQISNFDGTIEDCTNVLEYKPEDVKALIRRAQAFEACERYKSSLQDVRQVLALGQEACGKPTYDLANGMQHRLNRVIQQLRG